MCVQGVSRVLQGSVEDVLSVFQGHLRLCHGCLGKTLIIF